MNFFGGMKSFKWNLWNFYEIYVQIIGLYFGDKRFRFDFKHS